MEIGGELLHESFSTQKKLRNLEKWLRSFWLYDDVASMSIPVPISSSILGQNNILWVRQHRLGEICPELCSGLYESKNSTVHGPERVGGDSCPMRHILVRTPD